MLYYDENEPNGFTPEANPAPDADITPETAETQAQTYEAHEVTEPVREYTSDEEPQRAWSEPRYETSTERPREVYSPSVNTYTPPVEEKPKKEKKKHGFLRFVAAALACALLSGAVSYGVVSYQLAHQPEQEPAVNETRVVLGSENVTTAAAGSENPTPATAYPAGAKTGNEIYNDACDFQVVGVNTSINTTNVFGQTTSAAVSGTGFVVSSDGYIMTNYHVISYAVLYGGDLTVMFKDGTSIEAEVIGYSEENDVAVVKIDPTGLTLNPVTLGNSDDVLVGDTVYAIGNPLGELTFSMTDGIVSALDRIITTSESNYRSSSTTSINMFQITAAVNSGNSGGPVYNANGEVIGIVTAKYSDSGVEGLGFAIPINDAVAIATQLIEKGYVAGASLGINCLDVEDVYSSFTIQYYEFPSGVCVISVNEGSAAEKAGLQKGDIITALNGTTLTGVDELKMLLRKLAPGDEGTLTVYRLSSTLGSGEEIELSIVFDETAKQTAASEEAAEETEPSDQRQQQGQSGYNGFPWDQFWGYGSGNGNGNG